MIQRLAKALTGLLLLGSFTSLTTTSSSFAALAPQPPTPSRAAFVETATTVTLGFQGPLTGDLASVGQAQLKGVQYAISTFAQTHPNIRVNLLQFDDQCDLATAATVSQAVVSSAAIGIVGLTCSGSTIASLPAYKAGAVPLLSVSSSRDDLTDPTSPSYGGSIFHRMVPGSFQEGKYIADLSNTFITNENSGNPVIIASDGSTSGDRIQAVIQSELGQLSVLTNQTHTVNTSSYDYLGFAQRVMDLNPNVFIYTGFDAATAGLVYKALKSAGFAKQFIAGDSANDPAFIASAGSTIATGAIAVTPIVNSLSDISASLESDFHAFSSTNSQNYTAEAIEATNIFLSGVAAGNTTRASLNTYVNSYSGQDLAGNNFSFTTSGDPATPQYVKYQVSGGKFVYQGRVQGVSFASTPISETFTVKSANGAALPGANVRVIFTDKTLPALNAITDSSGQFKASFTCQLGNGICKVASIWVEPPSSDLTDAFLQTSTLGFAPGGNTELNLSRSNVKLNILNPNGDSASNVDFSFQNDSSQILKSYQFLRPGPVGIYISRTSIGTKYYLQVGNQTGQQKNQLTIFVVDDPNSSTLQLTDLMTGDLFPQDANGVLSVTLKALVLIEGQLLSSSGTQLIIPSSAIVHVGLELIESTTANWKGICQDSQADSAGNWSLVVDRLPAGKYQIQYWVDGSSAIPSFLGSYIWIDSQGKVSSQAATGFTTLVTVNQNIPAKPNLILQMTLPDGSSVDSGTVQI